MSEIKKKFVAEDNATVVVLKGSSKQIVIPALPEDASEKNQTVKAIHGELTCVEE